MLSIVSRRLNTLRVYYFASFTALGAFAPFFPRWLEARNVHGVAMGAVLATLPAMGLVGPPLVGVLADALGLRRAVLRVTCFGAFAAFAVLTILGAAGVQLTFAEIFVLVLIHAAFRSPMLVMADVVALERAADAGAPYGRVRLWGCVGFFLAAMLGGRFIDPASSTALPAAVTAPLFVALVAAWLLPDRTPPAGEPPLSRRAAASLMSGDVPLLLVTSFVAEIALSSYDACFSLYLGALGASGGTIGVAWAVGVVSEIALMTCASQMLARLGSVPFVLLALTASVIRWTLLASLSSVSLLVATQPLHALSISLWWLASVTYLKGRVPPRALATTQGFFAGAAAGGSIIGMLVWGVVYARAGGQATFGAAAIVALGATALGLAWVRSARVEAIRGIDPPRPRLAALALPEVETFTTKHGDHERR